MLVIIVILISIVLITILITTAIVDIVVAISIVMVAAIVNFLILQLLPHHSYHNHYWERERERFSLNHHTFRVSTGVASKALLWQAPFSMGPYGSSLKLGNPPEPVIFHSHPIIKFRPHGRINGPCVHNFSHIHSPKKKNSPTNNILLLLQKSYTTPTYVCKKTLNNVDISYIYQPQLAFLPPSTRGSSNQSSPPGNPPSAPHCRSWNGEWCHVLP